MQTGCPKCKTTVRANGQDWTITHGSCPELAGTPWDGKPEYCPVLSVVAEPDVVLPGVSLRSAVQVEIDRLRALGVRESSCVLWRKTLPITVPRPLLLALPTAVDRPRMTIPVDSGQK